MRMWLGLLTLALSVALAQPVAATTGAPPTAAAPVVLASEQAPHRVITLITGDQVILTGSGDEGQFSFVPAAGRPAHGYVSSRVNGHLRIIPLDVATLVPEVLDPTLFDITTLVKEHEESSTTIPIIWRMGPATAQTALPGALVERRVLSSIGAEGVELPKESAEQFGAALVEARAMSGAMPEKVWLDRRGTAALDRNLEQIGAPAAWAAGHDGTGVTIAILDSGVDQDHPDLTGRVLAAENFTDSADPLDRAGHGTHVASIAAGTGAASGGERRGVAFGSQILDAKVLGDDGTWLMSSAIAAAEWAVGNGADVVNMSLRMDDLTGTDPVVEAIESLSNTSDALFVVAAGNEGEPRSIGSPGTAPSALTVGAVNDADRHAGFSSRGPLLNGGPLKPEITAPGVDIIAAASSHSGFGDSQYVAMSGTSMATPHVAGGAALLMQKHPEWSAAQVKAALVSTAQEQPDAGTYDEGGGRLWLPDALATSVVPETPAVDLGLLPYPHVGETLTRELAWTNASDEPETVDLVAELPVNSGLATITPSTLALAPGATGTATLTVDTPASLAGGQHGGEILAIGGDVPVGIPFAYEREPERYDLTIRVQDANGAPNQNALVTLLNVDDMTRFSVVGVTVDETGTGIVRVPPGTYHAEAVIDTRDERNGSSMGTWVVEPEITVDGPTEVALDARTARPVQISVRESMTSREFVQVHEQRIDATGAGAVFSMVASGPLHGIATAPTDPVTTGSLDTYLTGRVAVPQLMLGRILEAPIPVGGAGTYVGRARLPVVDVGRGTEGEFAAAAVQGAVAVVSTRGEPIAAVLQAAQAAGVALVVLANDSDKPWQTFAVGIDVPAVTTTRAAAQALTERQSVWVRGSALPSPSFHMVSDPAGSFRADNRHVLTPSDVREMGRVNTAVAAIPGTGPAGYGVIRTPIVPGFEPTASPPSTFPQPGLRRTEFLQPGDWLSMAYRSDGQEFLTLVDSPRVVRERDRLREYWFGAPWRPLTRLVTTEGEFPAVSRSSEGLNLNLPGLADADGHPAEGLFVDPGMATYTVTVDGERLDPVQGPFGAVPLPPGPADVELQYDVDVGDVLPSQGRSRTVWTFSSAAPDESVVPQPLLEVDVQLPVNLRGTLEGTDVTVHVTRPFGFDVSLSSLLVEVSTDDGATWVPVATEQTGPTRGRASLPDVPAAVPLAIRISAVDANGDSVRQTLWEAALTAAE